LAGLFEIQVRILEGQSRRLDEYERESRAAQKRHEETQKQTREEFREFMRETREWQQAFQIEAQKKHDETIAWLKRIVEKLTDRLN